MIAEVDNAKVFIRRPRPTDQGFIAATWVDSISPRHHEQWDEREHVNRLVDRLLDDAAVRILVASEPTRTDVILGWLSYTPMPASRIVHYVYVRDRMRRRGIASALYRKAFPRDVGKLVWTMRGPDTEALVKHYRDSIHMPVEEFLGP